MVSLLNIYKWQTSNDVALDYRIFASFKRSLTNFNCLAIEAAWQADKENLENFFEDKP